MTSPWLIRVVGILAVAAVPAGCDTSGVALSAPPAASAVAPPRPPLATPAPEGAIDARSFGAAPGRDSRAAIQAALDAAGPGGTVTVRPAGMPYVLTAAGPNPLNPGAQFALRIPAGVTLHVAAGAVLQLADGQQSDAAGPVDVIVFDADDVTVGGGGTIRGNTAGQPGWSGGYQQITAGCLIRSWLPARTPTVMDLTLEDAFSNPVHLESHGPVTIARIRTGAVGEGPQVVFARDVTMEDIDHDDDSNVSVGDGVEVSVVERFSIRRVRVTAGSGGGAGSALDVFGSRNGVVEDFESRGWAYGIDVHDYVTTPIHVTDDIVVRRARIYDASTTAILSGPDQRGSVRYADIDVVGGGIGVQVFGPAGLPALALDSVRIANCVAGILLHGSRTVVVDGGHAVGSHPLDGVLVEDRGGGDAANLTLRAFSATSSTRHGVHVEAPALTLRIEGGSYAGNRAGPYHGLPRSAVIIRATPPP